MQKIWIYWKWTCWPPWTHSAPVSENGDGHQQRNSQVHPENCWCQRTVLICTTRATAKDVWVSLLWWIWPHAPVWQSWAVLQKLEHSCEIGMGITYTYLAEWFLAGVQTSLRNQFLSRYPGLFRGLLSSPSKEVRMLSIMDKDDPRSTNYLKLRHLWRRLFVLDKSQRMKSGDCGCWPLFSVWGRTSKLMCRTASNSVPWLTASAAPRGSLSSLSWVKQHPHYLGHTLVVYILEREKNTVIFIHVWNLTNVQINQYTNKNNKKKSTQKMYA